MLALQQRGQAPQHMPPAIGHYLYSIVSFPDFYCLAGSYNSSCSRFNLLAKQSCCQVLIKLCLCERL